MDVMLPRLVASDLDGTLLTSDGAVSARTAQVWSRLAACGVQTVIVTARPPRWLHGLGELIATDLPHPAWEVGEDSGGCSTRSGTAHPDPAPAVAICGNGAFVYDVGARRVIEAHGFTAAEARSVVAAVQRDFPHAGAAVETDRGMFRTAAYPDPQSGLVAHESDGQSEVGPCDGVVDCELDDLPGDVVVGKILMRDAGWHDDGFVGALAACLGSRGVLAYSGAAGLAEISAPGVTKAARLAQWCAARGIGAAEVWAFGDMPNDVPMLTWAGRGIAVANAHPALLAVADEVCGHHDEDGVAEYLAARLG